MTTTLYHHTDSARLPRILRDQSLEPGKNQIGGFPEDFLWATTDPMGDAIASSAARTGRYRDGQIAAVRFTLAADDFTPWETMKAVRRPGWEPQHFALLENGASVMGISPRQITQWWCRTEPLPAVNWLAVEFRTWRNPRWRAVQCDTVCASGDGMSVQLGATVFHSRLQRVRPDGLTLYAVSTSSAKIEA